VDLSCHHLLCHEGLNLQVGSDADAIYKDIRLGIINMNCANILILTTKINSSLGP